MDTAVVFDTIVSALTVVAILVLVSVGCLLVCNCVESFFRQRRLHQEAAKIQRSPLTTRQIQVPPAVPRQTQPEVVLSVQPRGPVRRHAPVVVRSRQPLWAEKGWRQEGAHYVGEFRANAQRWAGRIESPYPGAYTAYIYQPPLDALANHEHKPCFRFVGGSCYNVHFSTMPISIDHAITTIEAVLADALSKHKRGLR